MNSRPTKIYESLGVPVVINAAGTLTHLGGSLMAPEVVAAWNDAAQHFVDYRELQERVGEKIAELLGVEAALVTGGAAGGILLGTAAAITLRDPDFPKRFVHTDEPLEVLRPESHRDLYDRQIETCGVRIINVNDADDAVRRINDRTVLMASYNVHEPEGGIAHESWLKVAKQHSIPTLLDAAADVPPVENLRTYNRMGYDMVVFSGGKAIRGPQSSGLLLGRRELINAAKQNAVPNEGTVGRVSKVSKEDIVALWRALQIFVADGDQIGPRCKSQLRTMESMLADVPGLRCQRIVPDVANRFPHLLLLWDESAAGLTATEIADELRNGTPPIATGRTDGTGTNGLLISAFNLQPGDERIVAERIRDVFRDHQKTAQPRSSG